MNNKRRDLVRHAHYAKIFNNTVHSRDLCFKKIMEEEVKLIDQVN